VPFIVEANGADSSTVEVIPLDFPVLYPSLFEGTVDSAELHRPGSWQNIKAAAEAQGIDVYYVPLSDWGLRSYSKNVIARQDTIDGQADIVGAFVRALDAAVKDTLANATPEEIFALLDAAGAGLNEAPTLLDFEDFRASVSAPGPVDPAVVEEVLALIKETQGLETDLAVDAVYTNEFIPEG
jgi:ABC-type nitrate/sulfonate/bicarbonate transport system substrate-binding protein